MEYAEQILSTNTPTSNVALISFSLFLRMLLIHCINTVNFIKLNSSQKEPLNRRPSRVILKEIWLCNDLHISTGDLLQVCLLVMLYIKLNTYLLLSSYETNIRLNEIPPNSSGK